MVERHTRMTQNHLPKGWGFKSLYPHQTWTDSYYFSNTGENVVVEKRCAVFEKADSPKFKETVSLSRKLSLKTELIYGRVSEWSKEHGV